MRLKILAYEKFILTVYSENFAQARPFYIDDEELNILPLNQFGLSGDVDF
jgi:hypothetical protein